MCRLFGAMELQSCYTCMFFVTDTDTDTDTDDGFAISFI